MDLLELFYYIFVFVFYIVEVSSKSKCLNNTRALPWNMQALKNSQKSSFKQELTIYIYCYLRKMNSELCDIFA